MATTPEAAQRKWERNTENAGSKWKDGVNNPRRSVAEGLADFWGGSASDYSQVQSSYEDNVSDVSASDWEATVQGKGDTWRQRAERGVRNQ